MLMSVTKMTVWYGPKATKPRPRIGDRKVIRGVMHVRRQDLAHDPAGRVIGSMVDSRGRAACSWVPER